MKIQMSYSVFSQATINSWFYMWLYLAFEPPEDTLKLDEMGFIFPF